MKETTQFQPWPWWKAVEGNSCLNLQLLLKCGGPDEYKCDKRGGGK